MRPPNLLFQALFVSGVGIIITGGIQWQVARKQRTSFNNSTYTEDSRNGTPVQCYTAAEAYYPSNKVYILAGNSIRYRVLVGKNDTAGDHFIVEALIRPQAYGVIPGKPGSDAPHYHLHQQERIKVKEGKLGYYVGHHMHVKAAEAGQEVIIKPGEAHVLFNAGGGKEGTPLLLEITFTPARHGEALIETMAGLGYDYESVLAISPLQKWLTLGHSEVVQTDMSSATWDFIQLYITPWARSLGYKPFYREYQTKRHPVDSQQS